jgi:hypothetical protein
VNIFYFIFWRHKNHVLPPKQQQQAQTEISDVVFHLLGEEEREER